MSGRGTDWARLAELRENAADEEWQQRNPYLAAFREKLKRIRIHIRIAAKDFRESERGHRFLEQLSGLEQLALGCVLGCYLCTCRLVGCRPSRHTIVRELSTKQLLNELAQQVW